MKTRKIAFGFGIVTVLLTGFFAFVNLSEWYGIAIMKEVGDYHFGSEGPSPYYYRTSSLYGIVTFTWASIFLLNLIYAVWSMVKGKRRATMIGFVLSVIFVFVMFLHGQMDAG